MMLYVLPIMGGGNGAGARSPLSEISYPLRHPARSQRSYYSTHCHCHLTIANIARHPFATCLLDIIGKTRTAEQGKARLVRKSLL